MNLISTNIFNSTYYFTGMLSPTKRRCPGLENSERKGSAVLEDISEFIALNETKQRQSDEATEAARNVINFLLSNYDSEKDEFRNHLNAEAAKVIFCEAEKVFANEPTVMHIESDAWVIGDIHGNFGDLAYFIKQLIPFDITQNPYRIVCLGDYIDRGPFGVECCLLLFSLKILAPNNIILLRGNHEDPAVCGDENTYGAGSFRTQCKIMYGFSEGEEVFNTACSTFKYLPLVGIIDNKVFCAHGGIPRPDNKTERGLSGQESRMSILEAKNFPRYGSLFSLETSAEISKADPSVKGLKEQQFIQAFDLLWSDPIRDPKNTEVDINGFSHGERGGQTVAFSSLAVETFLERYNFDLMIRAHQEKRSGLRVSQSSKVITVFSSSNYQNHGNGAGVVLIRRSGQVDLVMKTS